MLMMLEEVFPRQNRMNEYPMGEEQEFQSMKEFIDWNIEQIDEILKDAPEEQITKDKLTSGEYTVYEKDGIIYVRVEVEA
jgi:hypothetical protein